MRRRRAIIRVHLLAVLAALAALCAGCASGTVHASTSTPFTDTTSADTAAHQGGGAAMTAVGGRCPDTATDPAIVKLRAQPAQAPLPADFRPVAAVRCMTQQRTVPGDGEWQFADAQRADSGLTAVLAALRLPSKTPPAGTQIACAAVGLVLPPFALVDANGALVDPVLPHDVCGMPFNEVLDAMNALPWHTETEQKLTQLQTQPEIDTGCASAYKDEFEIPLGQTPIPWAYVRAPVGSGPTTVCAYTVPPGSALTTNTQFERGAKLDDAQQAAVTQAIARLDGRTPAPACAIAATRFAMFSGGALNSALVELDGCHRIRWPNGYLQTAPAPLFQALAAAGIA